ALESGDKSLSVARPDLRAFPARVTVNAGCEVDAAMSAVPPATDNRTSKGTRESPPDKGLRGLMPYLRRYTGGIVFGLLTVVLMGIVGNVLPLATGVMTDTLAGNAVPFEHSIQSGAPVALGMNASKLSNFIPFYAPSS